jgi:hypothetical protein
LTAFHQSLVRHHGIRIDNSRNPGNYHIDDLAGNDYIVVGGGLGNCHFGTYAALLSSRYTRQTTVHLPADAIYRTFEDYECGDTFLTSEPITLARKEFKRYVLLAQLLSSSGYKITRDNVVIASEGKQDLRLMLWSSTNLMLEYLTQQVKEVA